MNGSAPGPARGSPPTREAARPALFWRVLAMMAAAGVIWSLMNVVSAALEPGPDVLRRVVLALLVSGLAVPAVVLARRVLDRRPWAGLAMPGFGRGWRPFLLGAACFAVPAAAGTGLALALGWLELSATAPAGEVIGWFLLLVPLVLLFEAVPEELIFRGYLYRNLAAWAPPWVAVLLQAVLFTLFGTALWVTGSGWGVAADRAVLFFSMGLSLGCLRLVTGSVWACVGFHLLFQVVGQNVPSERVGAAPEDVFLLACFVLAFVAAPTLAGLFGTGHENWTRPEPDPAPGG